MGMFDYVDAVIRCPYCGELINDFQSKDGDCLLEKISPYDVRTFYSSCNSCKEWVQIDVEKTFIKDTGVSRIYEVKLTHRSTGDKIHLIRGKHGTKPKE